MKSKNMLRIFSVALILLGCLLILSACKAGDTVNPDKVLTLEDSESGELYLYGVVKSGGSYYARILSENIEEPKETDFKFALLDDKLNASFQLDGWVGAWSPEQYGSAKALSKAYKDGKITEGARFKYSCTDGKITDLNEVNYYADNDVTGG